MSKSWMVKFTSLLTFFSLLTPCGASAVTNINTCADLQNMSHDLSGQYELVNDINCTNVNFQPIGTLTTPFIGTLDGKSHAIKYLTISQKNNDYVGLFGVTDGATISNVIIETPNILGASFVGVLIGMGKNTTLKYDHELYGKIEGSSGKDSSGSMRESLGGLVGALINSTIANSYTTADLYTTSSNSADDIYKYIGGLVGKIENTSITNSRSTGAIIGGSSAIGGLVGESINSSITRCYSTNKISASAKSCSNIGGLIGEIDTDVGSNSLVSESFSQASIETNDLVAESIGGLIGLINSSSTNCIDESQTSRIENSYATGKIVGYRYIGGLIGQITGSSTVLRNNYSIGEIASNIWPPNMGYGHLVGFVESPTSVCAYSSYYDIDTEKGVTGSDIGEGKTTSDMSKQRTYIHWDFVTVWAWDSNHTYPCLRNAEYC